MFQLLQRYGKQTQPALSRLQKGKTFYGNANKLLTPFLEVRTVPTLEDNYSYLLVDSANGEIHLVDPAEFETVNEAVRHEQASSGAELVSILTTHKHWDHIGGNERFAQEYSGIDIIGPREEAENIPCIKTLVQGGDVVQPLNGKSALRIKVLNTSYHTSGHVSYFVEGCDSNPPILFPGDSIFVGGCGRFFEGTAEDCYTALVNQISALPLDTVIYPGHEYTISNLKFALSLEPDNISLQQKYKWSVSQREEGKPTVPTTLAEEKLYNPFLRCDLESVAAAVGLSGSTPVDVLAEVRRRKDNY